MDPKDKVEDFQNNSDIGYGYDYYDGVPLDVEILELELREDVSDEKENHP
jgi:hypothetical protein